jgi:ABC-type transport system involved in cytochrome c biogenesis permease component
VGCACFPCCWWQILRTFGFAAIGTVSALTANLRAGKCYFLLLFTLVVPVIIGAVSYWSFWVEERGEASGWLKLLGHLIRYSWLWPI